MNEMQLFQQRNFISISKETIFNNCIFVWNEFCKFFEKLINAILITTLSVFVAFLISTFDGIGTATCYRRDISKLSHALHYHIQLSADQV